MAHDTFSVGDLTAVIGDNATHEGHRAGYNGLWSLRHRQSTRSIFVPKYEVNKEYKYRARAVLRPKCSREEILKEVNSWS
jgi:hypothetical protein